jgi:uncharacterized coiled-coil protein SlyX
MGSFIKTLAIAAGAGVAFGLCTSAGGRRAFHPETLPEPLPEGPRRNAVVYDPIDIGPLLDRLEAIERRFESVAVTPAPTAAVAELARRIDAQEAEIIRLREMVDVRAGEIQSRLEAEMDERHKRSIETIEKTVEFKVSERIAALEKAFSDQSASIEGLRVRAQESDSNLQRLIVAIERLCERTQLLQSPAPTAAAPAPGPVIVPFATQLEEIQEREVDPSTLFRSNVFRDVEPAASESAPKKSRSALTRIFGMIAILFVAGFATYPLG